MNYENDNEVSEINMKNFSESYSKKELSIKEQKILRRKTFRFKLYMIIEGGW
jgi:hypothetical protein